MIYMLKTTFIELKKLYLFFDAKGRQKTITKIALSEIPQISWPERTRSITNFNKCCQATYEFGVGFQYRYLNALTC